MDNKGFEVRVRNSEDRRVYCVDSENNIRGFYTEGFKQYISDWELWGGKIGKLEGNLKEEKEIIIDGKKFEVLEVREVSIKEKTSDPYVAGFDRPIFNPNFLS